MQLPVEIVVVGGRPLHRSASTRDISSGGVSFLSSDGLDPGRRVEYTVTLSESQPSVKIRCLGKVVRSQKAITMAEAHFVIGLTLERYTFLRMPDLAESSTDDLQSALTH